MRNSYISKFLLISIVPKPLIYYLAQKSIVVIFMRKKFYLNFLMKKNITSKVFISILVIALFYFWSINLYAQNDQFKFKQVILPPSLGNGIVNCIVQDRKGFMWFGTERGLCRYDGYNFKVYKKDPEQVNTLSNNFINAIYEDKDGYLWIGTRDGLNSYDPGSEKFEIYINDSTDETSLSHNWINSLHEDGSGTLWIGTNDGLNQYDRNNNSFISYEITHLNLHLKEAVTVIYEDRSGILWLGSSSGLYEYQSTTGLFINHKLTESSRELIKAIYEDKEGDLWIAVQEFGIVHFNRKDGSFEKVLDTFSGVNSIYEDVSGNLWVGGYGNFRIFNKNTGEVIIIRNIPDDPTSISNNWINTIYEDRSGMVWVGTYVGGVNIYNPYQTPFSLYRNHPKDPHSLSNNIVRSIYEDHQGNLWVATQEGGLNKLDRNQNTFSTIDIDVDVVNQGTNTIWSVIEDKSGVIWIGTRTMGIVEYDPSRDSYKSHGPYNYFPDYSNMLNTLYEGKSGNIWVGTGDLGRFDRKTKEYLWYKHSSDDSTSLSPGGVWTILEDSYGIFWVGTSNGLNRIEKSQMSGNSVAFAKYYHDPLDPKSISSNRISVIYEDQFKNLWIGTYGNGLNKYNRELDDFTYYPGLPDETIYGILDDDDGNLWISTNFGISKYDPQTRLSKNYGLKDKLQGFEFNMGAFHKSKSGEMFFGGLNGLNAFYPDKIREDMIPPQLAVTDFRVFNKSIPVGEMEGGRTILNNNISYASEITLRHDENVVSLEFASLSYSDSKANAYAYKLEGIDEDWNYMRNNRTIFLPNLTPDNYKIRLKASNGSGIWNEEGITLNIFVLPPWWHTWWARSGYGILAILIVIGIVSMRTKSLKIRQKQLENEVDNRTRELKNTQAQLVQSEKMASLGQLTAGVAHEINNPITFVKGGSIALTKDVQDLIKLIDMYVDQRPDEDIDAFKREIDLDYLLENVPLTIEDIKTGADRTADIVKGLRSFARLDEGEKQSVDINECIDSTLLLISDDDPEHIKLIRNYQMDIKPISCYPDQLNQAFLNIINNARDAMKDGGKLTITTEDNNGQVSIRFKDTGAGILEDIQSKIFDPFFTTKDVGEGTGLGLAITHGIIENHQGTIEVKSEVGKGSEFIITLPKG